MANNSDGSSQVEILKEELEVLLQESRNHVQWDGEKFVPKPMQLSRINLAKFRDSQSFQDRHVRVRYTTAELSVPIKIMEQAELPVVNEWNNLKEELKGTKKKLEKTNADLEETRTNVDNLSTKLNARTSELIDIGRMPTTCADLQRTGHKLSGFFSVKGSKKMEMIYCNFLANQNDKQKWIGYADVKSAPVHFYVQRNFTFRTENTPIPFELAVVNEGNAMDLTSGIFTAPRPGIYFFSFAGVAYLYSSSSAVGFSSHIHLNGNLIGSSYVKEEKGPVHQVSPVTLQSTLNLKKGDQLWVEIGYNNTGTSSFLADTSAHRTHFTGFMLEEEIAASF